MRLILRFNVVEKSTYKYSEGSLDATKRKVKEDDNKISVIDLVTLTNELTVENCKYTLILLQTFISAIYTVRMI